jgi:hypothetical protein
MIKIKTMAEVNTNEERSEPIHPFAGKSAKYKIFQDIIVSCGSLEVILKEGNQIEVQNPLTIDEYYIIINQSLLPWMTDLDGSPLRWKTNKKLLDKQRLIVY